LTAAALSGNLEIVKLVLKAGAKPDRYTLSAARESGNPEIVKLVKRAGAK
jgi:hypothetical protein